MDDLTREQAERLGAAVGRQLRYLNRLCARLDAVGWSPVDPLYRAAQRARDAVHGLSVDCHYASCSHGVGRPAKAPPQGASP